MPFSILQLISQLRSIQMLKYGQTAGLVIALYDTFLTSIDEIYTVRVWTVGVGLGSILYLLSRYLLIVSLAWGLFASIYPPKNYFCHVTAYGTNILTLIATLSTKGLLMMRVSAVCYKRRMAIMMLGALFAGGMAVKMGITILSGCPIEEFTKANAATVQRLSIADSVLTLVFDIGAVGMTLHELCFKWKLSSMRSFATTMALNPKDQSEMAPFTTIVAQQGIMRFLYLAALAIVEFILQNVSKDSSATSIHVSLAIGNPLSMLIICRLFLQLRKYSQTDFNSTSSNILTTFLARKNFNADCAEGTSTFQSRGVDDEEAEIPPTPISKDIV